MPGERILISTIPSIEACLMKSQWFCLFRTNDVFPHEFKWPYRLSRDNCCFAKNAVIYIISRDPETLVTLRIVMNAFLKFYSLTLFLPGEGGISPLIVYHVTKSVRNRVNTLEPFCCSGGPSNPPMRNLIHTMHFYVFWFSWKCHLIYFTFFASQKPK